MGCDAWLRCSFRGLRSYWSNHSRRFLVDIKMTSSPQVITEYGKQNIFARETLPQLVDNYTNYPQEAEKTNGRWAMIGIISLLVSYITTGQIIPGIF